MAKDSVTPEERLLRVIQNAGSSGKAAAWFHADAAWVRAAKSRLSPEMILSTRTLSTLVAAAAAVWAVHFGVNAYFFHQRFQKIEAAPLQAAEAPAALLAQADFAEIMNSAHQRNIFSATGAPSDAPAQAKAEKVSASREDLKLVGILWSDNPQAMLEDKQGKTYLVAQGETVTAYSVKKVENNRVILSDGPTEWELR